MEATNSLNIFTPTQNSVAKVIAPKKINPPSLKEALHIVSPKLLTFAMILTNKNFHDSEDLCQMTLMKLIENKEKFLEAEYPLAYSRRILRNAFIDKCRKDSRNDSLEALGIEPKAKSHNLESVEESEGHSQLINCLNQQNEIDRTILAMHGAGHDYGTIQKFIGKISMANLRTKTHRARKLLAHCMDRKYKS